MEKIKMKIGGIVIQAQSRFPLRLSSRRPPLPKYRAFVYIGSERPKINFLVEPSSLLPKKMYRNARKVFTTIHNIRNEVAWTVYESAKHYIITQRLTARKKTMVLNKHYTSATVYLSGAVEAFSWNLEDILYDCLQIALIGYFADKEGVLVHSAGVKDAEGHSFIFAGCSGAGKSTTARLWSLFTNARVLNDDRILLRKIRGRFFVFGTPWHGNFSDYPASITDRAVLKKVFFIYHGRKNVSKALAEKDCFAHLCPHIFPAFWDKKRLSCQIDLCRKVSAAVPSYRLGFVKDRSIIDFVNSLQ